MPTFKTMPSYRRYYIPNHSVFLTIVTFDRANWLGNDQNVNMLLQAMRWAKNKYPFRHIAHVILPDHLHWMLLPIDKTNFSGLVGAVKRNVTWRLKDSGESGPFWQNRFYDHVIRNDEDFGKYLDYVHYNPVKHGYVSRPKDYRWSTFQQWANRGVYKENWGKKVPEIIKEMDLE